MKKTLLTIIAAFAFCGAAMAQSAEDIAGKYFGDLYISLMEPVNETTEPMPNQVVDLTAGAEGIDFALHNFSFGGMLLGDIELPGIGISSGDGQIAFEKNDAREFSFLGGDILATALLNHESSYVKGDSLVATIDVVWTNGGDIPIYVLFKGKKLEAVDFKPLAGEYSGTLSFYDEAGENLLEERKEQKLTLAGVNANEARFSFGNLALGGTDWEDVAFVPAVYPGEAGSVAFVPSEKVYEYPAVAGDQTAQSMLVPDDCRLDAEGVTLKFLMACGETTYTGVYVGKLAVSAGIHTVAANGSRSDNAVYSLGGVRVADGLGRDLPKGIYIVNGKKIIK